jgi:hypothetical protein
MRFVLATGWHRRSIAGLRTMHIGMLGVVAPKTADVSTL